jgi:teichuronic acid biosynthesis glycosyltransferase TuaG
VESARGRYVAFLDSDDLWKPNKLERQIGFMRQEQVSFSFSSYDRISEDGEWMGTVSVRSPVNYRDLLLSNVIGCLTAVYDTERLGKMLMPDVRKRQDFALWLSILKKIDYAHPLPDVLATYRVRSRSVSSNKFSAAAHTWRIYRDVERLPLHLAAYYFANYAVRGALSHYGGARGPGAQ